MSELRRGLLLAARQLARSPGFAVTAILLLALGVGINAAIYALIDAVLLHPLPVSRPDRLVETGARLSYPDFQDLVRSQRAFTGMAAFESAAIRQGSGEGTRLLTAELVTADYFSVLGVRLASGRAFLPGEDRFGEGTVAVLSHDCWTGTFGGDRTILGRPILLGGQTFTVVGIAPEGFRGTHLDEPIALWLPVSAEPRVTTGLVAKVDLFHQRKSRWLRFVGRLRVPLTAAQAQVELFSRRWEREMGFATGKLDLPLLPLTVAAAGAESRSGSVRLLGLLAGVVGVVLLIACANLSNLFLVRALGRTQEVAIRMALGASRGAILRDLLSEALLLSLLAGGLAMLVTDWALKALARFRLPGEIQIAELGLGIDARMAVLVFLLALVAGLGCGALAMLALFRHSDREGALQRRGTAGPASARLRAALLGLQIMLSLPLLIGAGLLMRSVRSAFATDLGFRHENLALAELDLGTLGFVKPRAQELYDRLHERLKAIPEIRASSLVLALPLGATRWRVFPRIEGYLPSTDQETEAYPNAVEADYFRTLGIPLLRGRTFAADDTPQSTQVAVVNEAMVRRFWQQQDPLGKRITPFPGQMDLDLQVVGVVRDSRSQGLQEEPVPIFYVPFSQRLGQSRLLSKVYLVVRSGGSPADFLPRLQGEIRALDRNLPPVPARTFDDQLAQFLSPQRFGLQLTGFLGLLSLALAAIGTYGAVAMAVRGRTPELGIRYVLGARRSDVRRLVLLQIAPPLAAGLALGLALAFATTRLLEQFLYNVSVYDPVTFTVVAVGTLVMALAASYGPARCAGRIDPMVAMRQE